MMAANPIEPKPYFLPCVCSCGRPFRLPSAHRILTFVHHVRARLDDRGRPELYAQVAFPINARGRATLEHAILAAYDDAARAARPPTAGGPT